MANRHRGEIEARFDGVPHRLCLTLGALAELEAAFGDADMLALAQRFESGRLKASDAVRIIGAGLRGGGHDISDAAVGMLRTDGGAADSSASSRGCCKPRSAAPKARPRPPPAALRPSQRRPRRWAESPLSLGRGDGGRARLLPRAVEAADQAATCR